MNCERDSCGHPVSEHTRNSGRKCNHCPCPIPIVEGNETSSQQQTKTRQYTLHEEQKKEQARPSEGTTIRYLHAKFFEEAASPKGTICPVCERFGKLYKRKLHESIVHSLIRLYVLHRKHPTKEWFPYEEILGGSIGASRDFSIMKFWGLIENKPNTDEPQKHGSGLWKITMKGWRFVRGEETIPKYAVIYNDECRGFDGEMIRAEDVAGTFHYQRLMAEFI